MNMGSKEEVVVGACEKVAKDKYRSFLHDEGESNTLWRHGAPPTYHDVNLLFEQGRTKVWPEGSLEEIVQNAIKSWEMELSHKIRLQDFKTINPEKFKLFVNGREGLNAEETLKVGSYNALLGSSLPKELKAYRSEEETFESSHEAFRSAFPRGFAWEVIQVYSGPPHIAFKFRHWGFFEGPFKGHLPNGNMLHFYGLATLKVDNSLRVEEVEVYYDPGELLGGLISGAHTEEKNNTKISAASQGCPFSTK
ncbi:hypothetical protein HN51_044201 [Arachis hypogaea]|uniref:pathogen-related protein n=1 Tax=Arachis ipaensis TaxID=130454 RepID=UPI0007AF50D4|nr:pathogen-related protein [Arachis ipaensis]XP_025673671.1 pathogen-related protein [Arachis hypogaea]QHN96394.1 Pathogen-related protein [Arachis hypogaea]